MRIVLCYPVEAKHIAQIQAAAPEAEIVDAGQQRIPEEILEADIFCGHAKERPIPWDDVVRKGRLKWIQSSAAGLDHCLAPAVVESEIVVTSASGVLADQVAEQTMALLTGLLRSLPTFFRAQQAHEFIRRPTRDLHRATIGIIGFGGNGRRLAEVLRPYKGRIIATDWFPTDKPASVDELWPADRNEELIALADVLILAAPLTSATRGMINARTLATMKPSAVIVNVARGKLVVEQDLIAALETKQLAGFATDVTEIEPLPDVSPLWNMPEVIITPHVGGQSKWRIDDMTDFFCDNLRRRKQNLPLINLVDKRLGFPAWTPR
ncbi:MAG: D-2-hydroxyacid dehydrogenase [Planctomycetaceae bacterium]|nr:D-2-hydroxyacid dehydrogenase [Planctomycetaceae bacterium]